MLLIKVGAAVLNQTPRDWKGNLQNIIEAIREAQKENVTILCLPELCITGYGLEDDFFCPDITERAMKKLVDLTIFLQETSHRPFVVSVGLPIRFDNAIYNAVATIVNGKIVGFTCKQHLAGDGIHYEPRWFKPWPAGVVQTISSSQENIQIPIGDIHFCIGGIKIGYEICEDAWVASRPGAVLASKGVDIILNPSASHFSFGKLNIRKNFVVDGSRAFNCTYIYSNLVGNEAGRAIYDGGALIASGGSLLAVGKRFTYQNALLTTAVIDVNATRTAQVRTASFQPNLEKFHEGCIEIELDRPYSLTKEFIKNSSNKPIEQEPWETSPYVKHEECTRAIGLALMDYMRKSKQKGFVISLSGGADSAMVTALCAYGIWLGVDELGDAAFAKKYCPHITDTSHLSFKLITTAYQSTAQSGEVTLNAAKEVADWYGTEHFVFDIEPIVKEYLKIGNLIVNRNLSFDKDDLTMQNIQARGRAPSIWMVANLHNKLLLTTSNMSEAAVGYCTLDGDTCGGLAPISGIPKVYVREYLKWMETDGPTGYGKCEEMSAINNQQPTAELRPPSDNQTDEKDLMPYWLLHEIEKLVANRRYSPKNVYLYLISNFERENKESLKNYVIKFFRLFSTNQWKRERLAPCFHVDDHNLDPRTWCRQAILNGGYEEELEELRLLST